jgi:chemotaxis protein CheC
MAISKLTSLHLDTLQEISNIGVGQAATALSQLLRRRIDIRIPRVAITPFKHAADDFGGAEAPVAAVALRMGGDALGHVMLLFEPVAAGRMAGTLTAGPGKAVDLADPMARSVLQEVGNILASAYLNALGRLTGLVFLPSVPVFAHDMVGAVVDAALIEQGEASDVALVMETTFDVDGEALAGQMLLLPHPSSLERIFRAVGVAL